MERDTASGKSSPGSAKAMRHPAPGFRRCLFKTVNQQRFPDPNIKNCGRHPDPPSLRFRTFPGPFPFSPFRLRPGLPASGSGSFLRQHLTKIVCVRCQIFRQFAQNRRRNTERISRRFWAKWRKRYKQGVQSRQAVFGRCYLKYMSRPPRLCGQTRGLPAKKDPPGGGPEKGVNCSGAVSSAGS